MTDQGIHSDEDRPEAHGPPSRLQGALAHVAEGGGAAGLAELRLAVREYVLASRDSVRVEHLIVVLKREAAIIARRRMRADDFGRLIWDIVHWCVDDYYGAPTDSVGPR